jgi:hypothetical protein
MEFDSQHYEAPFPMAQVEKTRLRCLSEARRAELVASALKDKRAQDEILDETVWRRLLASLPSYNPAHR